MKITFLLGLFSLLLIGCKTKKHELLYQNLWTGTITAPDQKITLYFGFKESLIGASKCYITIPQQDVYELTAPACTISNDSLFIEFSDKMVASFKAELRDNQILGKWTQNNYTFPLTLVKSNRSLIQLQVEQALNIAKENSVYSDEVDWVKLNTKVMARTRNITTQEQIIPILHLIHQNLKDEHGFILYNNKSTKYEQDDYKEVTSALKQAAFGYDKDIVSTKISDSIGYLRIPKSPHLGSDSEKKYNQQIQKQVRDLINKNTKHWIIDLRLNYGGNMFTMLDGLYDLLGDKKVGSFVTKDRKEAGAWIVKRPNFSNQKQQLIKVSSQPNASIKPGKIAILIGPITASSGEALAVALKSLNHSKSFGEPTKGFCTSLSGFNLGNDLIFFISTSFYSDVKGHVYTNGLTPDLQIDGGDNFKQILLDKKVLAAVNWINI